MLELHAQLLPEGAGALRVEGAGVGLEPVDLRAKRRLPIGPRLDRSHELMDQPVIARVELWSRHSYSPDSGPIADLKPALPKMPPPNGSDINNHA